MKHSFTFTKINVGLFIFIHVTGDSKKSSVTTNRKQQDSRRAYKYIRVV